MAGLYLNHVKVAEESGGIVSLPNTVQFNNLKIGGTEVINSNRQIQNITGIDFSPSSGTGTPSSNLLDDYEEGTWTPSVAYGSISGTSITYTGKYTLVGNILTIYMTANSSSGNLQVSSYVGFSGLPFAIANPGTSTVITEDIDYASRHGFVYLGFSSLFFSACGSSSGTTSLYTTVTTFI